MGGWAQMRWAASGFEMGFRRNYLLVKDAADSNAVRPDAIENDVLAMLGAVQTWTHLLASSSNLGILNEHFEAALELGDVPGRLIRAPGRCGVPSNFSQI
jgi:hypothetical protein